MKTSGSQLHDLNEAIAHAVNHHHSQSMEHISMKCPFTVMLPQYRGTIHKQFGGMWLGMGVSKGAHQFS